MEEEGQLMRTRSKIFKQRKSPKELAITFLRPEVDLL